MAGRWENRERQKAVFLGNPWHLQCVFWFDGWHELGGGGFSRFKRLRLERHRHD